MTENATIKILTVDDHPFMMAGISGEINAQPDMKVVLTSTAGDIQVLRAFKAGAVGYLLKNLLRTELIETIRTVHAGHRRIPSEIAQQLALHATDDALTPRELEVLRCVTKGQSNKIIASELNIAEHTVKNHIKSILSKLDADDRTGAAIIALRRGYIDL